MSDPAPTVFISYAHEDEAWKDRLVRQLRVLELEGDLDVWEDREIAAGDDWRQGIEQAIDRAHVAVLLISADFLISDFIRRREVPRILGRRASEGLRVIPLIVRPCAWTTVKWLNRLQARPTDGRPLSSTSEHLAESDLCDLAVEIQELLAGTPAETATAAVAEPPVARRVWRSTVAWLLLPTLLAVLIALVASWWRRPTRVEVELTTRRIAFTVGGETPSKVLNVSVPFSSLIIERCEALTFAPTELTVQEPTGGDSGTPPAWRPLTLAQREVRLACRDPDAKLALRGPEPTPATALGSLDRIDVESGSQVVLAVSAASDVDGARELEITVEVDLAPSLTIAAKGELTIDADLAALEGVAESPTGDYQTYRAGLESPDPWLELRSKRGPTLIVVPPAGAADGLFVSSPIPVENVELLYETLDGGLESPLLTEARLSYPTFPSVPAVTVPPGELLGIGQLGTAQLERLALDDAAGGLRLVFDGVAGKARSTDRAFTTDYRLTVWDRFAHSPLWGRLAAVAVWALSTAVLGFESWKKLSRPAKSQGG